MTTDNKRKAIRVTSIASFDRSAGSHACFRLADAKRSPDSALENDEPPISARMPASSTVLYADSPEKTPGKRIISAKKNSSL